jgi:hypothetical protein
MNFINWNENFFLKQKREQEKNIIFEGDSKDFPEDLKKKIKNNKYYKHKLPSFFYLIIFLVKYKNKNRKILIFQLILDHSVISLILKMLKLNLIFFWKVNIHFM